MGKSICNELRLLYNQLEIKKDVYLFSCRIDEVRPFKFRYLKYKLVYTIINLQKINICNEFDSCELPDVDDIFDYWCHNQEFSDWYEIAYKVLWEFDNISQLLLEKALINTSWVINVIYEMADYENLSDDVIKQFNFEISLHWGAWNYNTDEEYKSEKLRRLGCEPIYLGDMYMECCVIITNEKVNNLLNLAKTNKYIKEEKEYKELLSILDCYLFYDIYDVSVIFDSKTSEQYYEFHILGQDYNAGTYINFYQLDYSQIVGLLLADVLTNRLLTKYDKGGKKQT